MMTGFPYPALVILIVSLASSENQCASDKLARPAIPPSNPGASSLAAR